MKRYADGKRYERQFSIGAWVYLKLQPYAQSSLATRSNQKLSFKLFWAFSSFSQDWSGGLSTGASTVFCHSSRLSRVATEAGNGISSCCPLVASLS